MSSNYYNQIMYIENLVKDGLYDKAYNTLEKLDCLDTKEYFLKKLPKSFKDNTEELTNLSFNKVSELSEREAKSGISIVTCCMNRNDNLRKAIISWLKLNIDEIVVVDWSSEIPVAETLAEFRDPRIKIIEVKGESRWVLTYGFNVGLRFASYSKIYKLDADIIVSSSFLSDNTFSEGSYIRGSWKKAIENGDESQVFVNGSFGAYREDLKQIGYYNELIRTYGWDDSDLYERLSSEQGLASKELSSKSIYHMFQCPSERTKFQEVSSNTFLGKVEATEFNNYRNKYLGRTTTHWNRWRLQDYSVKRKSSQIWQLERITNDIEVPLSIMLNANVYAATYFLSVHYPLWAEVVGDTHLNGLLTFLLSEYNAKVDFEQTLNVITSNKAYLIDKSSDFDDYTSDDVLLCLAKDYSRTLAKNNELTVVAVTHDQVEAINKVRQQVSSSIIGLDLGVIDESISNRQQKRKLYVDAQHGLGNRLRAIGSAAAIAKGMNRELVIVWQPDHHCECRFSDLFNYDGLVIEDSSGIDKALVHVYNYMEIEDGAEKDELIDDVWGKDLYLRSAYVFNSPYSNWNSENEFIRSLIPTTEITTIVESVDVSNCIAAHVRMEAGAGLDHNTYDSIENWTEEGHQAIHFWREKSHYSHFIKRIDELFEQDSQVKLFLATDLPETYKVFEDYYGDRLSYLRRNDFDRSRDQIKYALADAILLSKCDKLLGSTWSSFSELATRLSKTYSEIEMSGSDF